jgi:hypothetical protein
LFVLAGIGNEVPPQPEQRTKVPFSYQLIRRPLLAVDVNDIIIPGVIGLPKGVLFEAMSPKLAALQATVAGIALPDVRRKPAPPVTEGQVIEQSAAGPAV